jgi:hypothetical protein
MGRGIKIPLLTLAMLWPAAAKGQEYLVATPGAATLAAENGNFAIGAANVQVLDSSPLFLGAPSGRVGIASGSTGTAGATAIRTADGQNLGTLSAGFDFLKPFWSFRDFNLAVPPAFASSFPVVGDIGHTDNHFAFVPRIQYDYFVKDLDFGISASGKFLSLTGSLQRNFAVAGGSTGNLVSNDSLTLVTVNPVEFTKRIDADTIFGDHFEKECITDGVIDLTIGTRYISLDQNYSGSLNATTTGSNVASRYTHQTYKGIGLTGAVNWLTPLATDIVGFSNLRASILGGDNNRNSTLSVTRTGVPGAADTISESKTLYAPVVEWEVGVEWGKDLGELLRHRQSRQQITVRVSGSLQYFGSLGPLSAGSTQGFQTNDLFLAGISVQIGFRH